MLEAAGLLEGANLYDFENTQVVHHTNQALRAKHDVQAGHRLHRQGRQGHHHRRVHRPHDGRPALRSDGLHQAVEAKEGVQIEPENQTMASITFQNWLSA